MQCAILAGGLGTRIRSVSGDTPKALIPVAGRPFAFHQLEWLAGQGVVDVVYCVGHKGDEVEAAVGDGAAFGLSVKYSYDGPELLGTGGALRLAIERGLLEPAFFILYADSWLTVDLPAVWRRSDQGRHAVMTVILNENKWDRSNVRVDGDRVALYDKGADPVFERMSYVDYGVSVMPREVLAGVKARAFDLADVMHDLSRAGRLRAFEVYDRFYEIGSPSGLAELEALFSTVR